MVTLLLVLTLFTSGWQLPQAETVFRGRPSVQIITTGEDRTVKQLSVENADGYECLISKIGADYYWATRENRRMIRVDGPAYTLFLAAGGEGYVKVVNQDMKQAASLVDAAASKYDYVEHISMGLGNIAYLGRRR